MEKFYTDPKICSDILSKYLASLMSEVSEIRTNTSRLIIGISAAFFAVAGWAMSNKPIEPIHFSFYILILFVFLAYTLVLLNETKKYFMQIARTISKIDEKLLAFKTDTYIKGDTLLPIEWRDFGEHNWREPIFMIGIPLVIISAACSLLIVTLATIN